MTLGEYTGENSSSELKLNKIKSRHYSNNAISSVNMELPGETNQKRTIEREISNNGSGYGILYQIYKSRLYCIHAQDN